jgi:prolyl-tRNA synthetase
MQDGKALQFGTSHNLGQNFAKVFDVSFLGKEGVKEYGWQTSWGLSTRTIGGLIMVHSDDKGLVLPPNMAPVQAVLLTIGKPEDADAVSAKATELAALLKEQGVRVEIDSRDIRPGEKFYEWEKKGVPLRIEIGPKDIENNSVMLARRDQEGKEKVVFDALAATVIEVLEKIQKNLFERAKSMQEDKMRTSKSWEEFKTDIETGNFVVAFWDGTEETEKKIKEETGATIRCIPFNQKPDEGVCVYSGTSAAQKVIFAKAY